MDDLEKQGKRISAMELFETNPSFILEHVPEEQRDDIIRIQFTNTLRKEYVGSSDEVHIHSLMSFTFPTQEKIYVAEVSVSGVKKILFVDEDGKGYGVLRNETMAFSEGNPVPYTSYTETDTAVRQEGRAVRRLWLMNQYAKKHFGQPLFSWKRQTHMPHIWDALQQKGFVRVIQKATQGQDAVLQLT